MQMQSECCSWSNLLRSTSRAWAPARVETQIERAVPHHLEDGAYNVDVGNRPNPQRFIVDDDEITVNPRFDPNGFQHTNTGCADPSKNGGGRQVHPHGAWVVDE